MQWPGSVDELVDAQRALASSAPPAWSPPSGPLSMAGCFVCFPRGVRGAGAEGDRGWAGAALTAASGELATARAVGAAGAAYEAGLLALREGPLLETVVRALPSLPDLLLVNATGRDHPRRAGLALHLGAVLGLPTVGVTQRPLLAVGEWPAAARGERSPLLLDGQRVGYWLRTRSGRRPLAVHAAWRTDPEVAVEVVLSAGGRRARTPEPLRQARRAARSARAAAEGERRGPRLARSTTGSALPASALEIATAPRETPPFPVDALAIEDDTWLVLGADPTYREPREHLLRVLADVHTARPEPPGSVVVRPGRPLRLHAVVHDLERDPTWSEGWIETALRGVFETAEERGLESLGLEPLGCRFGRFGIDRFRQLLARAVRDRRRRDLRRIWLVVP